ncbi:MFS transporter [Cupriavidus basilensis]|uniref:MFS transporter n=1 Tax=Cupriavidus basilensis TaxID=68895 RepID=UPI000750FF5A|nr:MFS transporter [Cupriavidus basilensis]
MRQQVFLLAIAQALFQTASVLVMTVGALAGSQMTSVPALATLPIATMFLGTATMMFPASAWMARAGRRTGFVAGATSGLAGGMAAAYGVMSGSLAMLAFGTFLVGVYQAFAQFYRFAASEVATEAFRPRAISLVMAGGVIAALLGPALARFGSAMLPAMYAGSFLLLSLVSTLAIGVLSFLHIPREAATRATGADSGRPWLRIVCQPSYLVALFGATTGYGVMILAMTATPLAMVHHHHAIADAATVIQFHVLGMFLPSFFTGTLIGRFGAIRVMLCGVCLLATHVLATSSGTGFASFASALVLLGVGWNFLFIGGTSLLTETYSVTEKSRAQATNDMTIFAVGLSCSFGAGGLLKLFGWQTMNLLLLPWLGAAALALFWLSAQRRKEQNWQGTQSV